MWMTGSLVIILIKSRPFVIDVAILILALFNMYQAISGAWQNLQQLIYMDY